MRRTKEAKRGDREGCAKEGPKKPREEEMR